MEAMSQDEDLVPESNNNFNSDELTTPGVVNDQLKNIAETGIVCIDWPDLQRALKLRLKNVLDHYYERNRDCKEEQYHEPNVEKFNLDNSRDEILELIDSFTDAPFTIQRICELLHSPFKYYDRVSTFLRGLEKNLRVISSNNWPKSQVDTSKKDENSPSITSQSPPNQQQPQQHYQGQESIETSENIQAEIHPDEGSNIQTENASDSTVSEVTKQAIVADQDTASSDKEGNTDTKTDEPVEVEKNAQETEGQEETDESQIQSSVEEQEDTCVQTDLQ